MGRKKEDREAKADHKKARRFAKEAENDEDDSISLAHQLAPLGKAEMASLLRFADNIYLGNRCDGPTSVFSRNEATS